MHGVLSSLLVLKQEHERYKVANIQSHLDEIQAEMIKTAWLEMWAKYMEGDTTPVLSILDNRTRKLDMGEGGGIIVEGPSAPNDTPYLEIIPLEKKWKG